MCVCVCVCVSTRSSPAEGATPRYIVVSFADVTLVLAVGETVAEDTTSGLLTDVPTLSAALMEDDAIVQVHTNGVLHISATGQKSRWQPPGGKTIVKATVNSRQCAVALTGGEIVYFELNEVVRALVTVSLDGCCSNCSCPLTVPPCASLRLRTSSRK